MSSMGRAKPDRPRLADRHRAQRIEAVRKEIIDAAIVEFIDRGYHETSMAHIAEHLGTGASTVYSYFTSKQEILERAIDDTITGLAESLAVAAAGTAELEQFHEGANRFGDAVADIFVKDPKRARMLLIIATSTDPALRERWTGLCRLATSAIEAYLARGVADGYLRADLDPNATAHAIVAIPIGMLACDPTLELFHEQAHARVRATVALVTNGIYRDNR
jgi:AcrR family transcriptional regulator